MNKCAKFHKDIPSGSKVIFNLASAVGALRIRHSIRQFATQPVILWILLGGKPGKMASIELWFQ